MSTMKTLQDLYKDELKDLWSAESQIVRALPKMKEAASSPQLKQAFENHLQVTEKQLERLGEILAECQIDPKGKTCEAMKGLLKEGEEIIQQQKGNPSAVTDAALIGAAQRVEHYEIAAYGTIIEHAKVLGFDRAAAMLHETLEEEKQTDEELTLLAESSINEAAQVGA